MKKVRFDRICLDCGADIATRGPRAKRCFPCQRAYRKCLDKQRKSTDAYRAYKSDYNRRNAEKNHQYYLLDKERLVALHRSWRAKHPHKEAEYARKRRATHPEVRERDKQWAVNNPDKFRAYRQKWISDPENYQRKLIMNAKRRAIKRGVAINDFTIDDWNVVLCQHEYRCVYCGKEFPTLTQDHVIPLSRGGNHTKDNIVPACRSCNSRKGNRLIEASC